MNNTLSANKEKHFLGCFELILLPALKTENWNSVQIWNLYHLYFQFYSLFSLAAPSSPPLPYVLTVICFPQV